MKKLESLNETKFKKLENSKFSNLASITGGKVTKTASEQCPGGADFYDWDSHKCYDLLGRECDCG